MANKIIIGILVLLVMLMGGSGYYSYMLTQQINDLGERLTVFEMEQTARIDAVNNELIAFRGETLSSINTLEDKMEAKIEETLSEIDTLEEETEAAQNRITSLEDEIDGVKSQLTSQVDILEERLTETFTELSRSMINAGEVYDRVIQATVRIGNGQSTFGSGFIFDTEGHVVTNYHVVANISQTYVILYDGRVSKATKIGYCPYSDIAVLKLKDNPHIEPPPLADSSQVIIGEPVVAIGSPFGLRDTLTTGIISQVNRVADVANLLQFDAAVNPGNSGGPLANSKGEILGVVTARVPPTEGDGICYAVSSSKAKRVATAIIEQGSFDYPWVGIGIVDLTPEMVQDRALETANGALVDGVTVNSPAEAAGIEDGDIIVSIDGVMFKDRDELKSYVGEFKSPGDMVTVKLIRGTTELELSLEIGRWQE